MKQYSAEYKLGTSYDTLLIVRASEDGIRIIHQGNGQTDEVVSFTTDEVDHLIAMLRDAKANLE